MKKKISFEQMAQDLSQIISDKKSKKVLLVQLIIFLRKLDIDKVLQRSAVATEIVYKLKLIINNLN